MPTASLSSRLVERIAAFRLEDAPRKTVDKAKFVLLDTLGEALAASRSSHALRRGLAQLLEPAGGRGEASAIGRAGRVGVADAAFFNAALAAFGLTDPLHAGTTMHAPATVAAAALALCEREGGDGTRLLESFLLGVEVACRTSAALGSAALYARGFHPTAVCGAFGAAAAAGRMLRLEPKQLAAAMGLAFQQAGGALAWVTDPTECARPLSPAIGARNGVSAALLAAAGLGGPPSPFDGPHSVFVAFSGEGEPDALLEGWGKRFYIDEISHKLHASCSYTHAALDGLLELRGAAGCAVEHVRAIEIGIVPAVRKLVNDPGLRSCYMPYIVAIGLARGRVAVGDVVEDRADEPEIARLMKCTTLVDDAALADAYPERCGAAIELRLADGTTRSLRVDAAKGTPANPLADTEILEKFRIAAGTVLPPDAVGALARRVGQLGELRDIGPLAALLRDVPANPRT